MPVWKTGLLGCAVSRMLAEGLTPGHAILSFPEHRVQSFRCLFTDAFTTCPFSCLDTPIIFLHDSCSSSFPLAGSQPAPTLPTATKPATLEHPLFHDSVMQILEAAKAFPAGRPILTRAGRKSSIKKCWFNHTGKTVSSQWKCNQNYL